MWVSAPFAAAVLSGGGLKAMVTKSANWGKRLCQTHRQRKQLQGELCDSLTLLPNTPKPCEDKPSRSVKLLLRLLGTLKKKPLRSPEVSRLPGHSQGRKCQTEAARWGVGAEMGAQQVRWEMGSTHMGSRQAPVLFPWLLWAGPQI